MAIEMPASLQAIAREVQHFQASNQSATTNLDVDWQAYLQVAVQRVPGLTIDVNQATVCLGELSPGCQACKDGTWDCIFITKACNLNCAFCYNPHSVPENYAGSAFGDTYKEIAANHLRTHLTGISISGGEPFLERDRLLDWAARLREQFPESYLWIYTNGTQIDLEALQELGQIRVDEIRFNSAATGYDNAKVMATIRQATHYIERITVEIPAIPDNLYKVKSCLCQWSNAGVRYLNLHELIYEPGTNSWVMGGPRQEVTLTDRHHMAVHPHSREMILELISHVQQEGISLFVNHCSLQNKIHQLHGRRLSLLPLTQAPYEKSTPGDLLESFCFYFGDGSLRYCHPDKFLEMHQRHPQLGWVRLARTAPLGVHDKGQWVVFEAGGMDE